EICTIAREVAPTAKMAYTAIRTRPGPVAVLRISATDRPPQLTHTQHNHRDSEADHAQYDGTGSAVFRDRPCGADRQCQYGCCEIGDEGGESVRRTGGQ